jgi:1-acyl-sn-glycerol-3-phosphate acyltransferase
MVASSLFFDLEPPRHVHGMVEYFAQKWPFVSPLFSRLGHVTGLPEHADRFLRDQRLILAFPEGARGTGKLYRDRYKLVRFGTGFVRLALRTQSPIIPFAFVGGEEAVPTVLHLKRLARLVGAPYLPVTPYGLPLPLPVPCQILYGEPLVFAGDGTEPDDVIQDCVNRVRDRIEDLLRKGLHERKLGFPFSNTIPSHLA